MADRQDQFRGFGLLTSSFGLPAIIIRVPHNLRHMQLQRKLNILILTLLVTGISSCNTNPPISKHSESNYNVPLSLHPVNPHYFLFRGNPEVLIGSTEHYGAVMNLDFDYIKYLNELKASGLNVTRTFTGFYVEPAGAFGIKKNTMAPASGRFICPWSRSSQPGYANGGNRFDLSVWDESYFTRLKDFIGEAGKRNIIVELDLFSNIYDTVQWKLSPLYYSNNVNSLLIIKDWKEVLSLRHPDLLAIQVKMAKKIVSELKDFDNLYYEVCNEPYFGDTLALRDWEGYMTGIVAEAEKDFSHKHLISNNIANGSRLVSEPRANVSVYNFHYAHPPVTVAINYPMNLVIGDNETGFDGISDATYRREAWDFIMAGGAIFNNLDYSFTTDNEDGSFVIEEGQPGGGGKTLRGQLKILSDFIRDIDFINMKPAEEDLVKIPGNSDTGLRALAGTDNSFAIYLSRKTNLAAKEEIQVDLKQGTYSFILVDTRTGEKRVEANINHKGGWINLSVPEFTEDIALRIVRTK
jgi:hypothetical protein